MLNLMGFLFEAGLFIVMSGTLLGLLAGWYVVIFRWAGCAYRFCFELATGIGDRLADCIASLLRMPPARPTREELQTRIVALETSLASALGRAAGLSRRVEDLRAELKTVGCTETARVYATVGLHPSSPEFLIRAARQSFRKSFHPDVCRTMPPEEAVRKFQEAESTFERIWQHRHMT